MYRNDFEKTKATIRKEIGHIVKYSRTHASKSQQELADLLRISKSNVSRYEKGITEIPASIIPIISYHCHITLKDMLKKFHTDEIMSEIDNLDLSNESGTNNENEFLSLSEDTQELIMAGKTVLEHTGLQEDGFSSHLMEIVANSVKNETHQESSARRLMAYYKRILDLTNKKD